MTPPEYSLKRFLQDTEVAVRNSSSEGTALREIKPRLEKHLVSKSVPQTAFLPRNDRFAMNLLHMPDDKAFSTIAGARQPGQTTPIHDHLTWTLTGVYEGEEREALHRRTDNGSNPKFAKLELVSEKINTRGHVTVLGKAGIHRVDNMSDRPAFSIHVYGGTSVAPRGIATVR